LIGVGERHARVLPFVAALVLACATPHGPEPAARPEATRAYQGAMAKLEKSPAAGEAALRRFLVEHADSVYSDDAALELARRALADGREQEARMQLRWIVRNRPSGDRSDQARLLLARLQRKQGDPRAAYETASQIRLSLLGAADRRVAQRLLADLAGEAGDAAGRLRWLARVRADAKDPRAAAQADREIDAALAGVPPEALEALAGQLGRRRPAARVRLEQAERALQAENEDAAAKALEQAAALPMTSDEGDRLAALRARLKAGIVTADPLERVPSLAEAAAAGIPDLSEVRGALGVVLPLSGPYAHFGEETLQGVLLAARLFGVSAARPSQVRVEVRDSAGDPERAAAALRELAKDPEVLAVIGPLLTAECEVAGGAAEQVQLPMLALTRREGIALGRRFVMRLGSTPRLEALLLADYATRQLGLSRFAILYPDDPFGRALRADFWDAVEARGGQVVGVARYPAEATDFAAPIRRLIGFDLLTPQVQEVLDQREKLRKRAKRLRPEEAAALRKEASELTGPDGEPLPPFVDFEALFIPDAGETVALIAPHLAFHEVRGVRLLGPSDWNFPQLVSIGGKYLNGAVFTSRFFAGSRLPHTAAFASHFARGFGSPPTFLAAQAYDAAQLVLAQLARGANSREAVLGGLLSTHSWPGTSGVIDIGRDGGAVRRPYLLGVERRHVVSIDETGKPPLLPLPPSAEAAEEGSAAGNSSTQVHP